MRRVRRLWNTGNVQHVDANVNLLKRDSPALVGLGTALSLAAEGHSQVAEALPSWVRLSLTQPRPAACLCRKPSGAGHRMEERHVCKGGAGRRGAGVAQWYLCCPHWLKGRRTGRTAAGPANGIYRQCRGCWIKEGGTLEGRSLLPDKVMPEQNV